jgi:hypothetical protein
MDTHTSPTHPAYVDLDADGGLTVKLHIDETSVARLDPNFLMGNNLFDEDRKGMTYEDDSRICTEILDMLIRVHGYAVDTGELASAVRLACTPGPIFDPADYNITLWEDAT